MESMTITVEYKSPDSSSLQDVNIREYGHMTRINDEAAEYFYALHSSINAFFGKRTVTRNTPSMEVEQLNLVSTACTILLFTAAPSIIT